LSGELLALEGLGRSPQMNTLGAVLGGAAIALSEPMGEFQPGHQTGIALETSDAKAAHAELKDKGIDVDEELMGGDGTVPLLFGFRDGDGNSLMIVEQ